jgi:hypothetical protein
MTATPPGLTATPILSVVWLLKLTHAVTRADRCFSLGVGWSSW